MIIPQGKAISSSDHAQAGPNAANGQVNIGQLQGIGRRTGAHAVFDLDGCTAIVTLSANGITVEDESGCGGMNVSFIVDKTGG